MIDHVSVPVRSLSTSLHFYDAVLKTLGLSRLVLRDRTAGYGKRYPEFWVNVREDNQTPNNTGAHIALRAKSESTVNAFYMAALVKGGTDDGPPGIRQGEVTSYYGAFIRDPDGNRIEAVPFPPLEITE